MHRLQIARPSPFARGTILLSLSSKVQELYTKYTDPFFMRVILTCGRALLHSPGLQRYIKFNDAPIAYPISHLFLQ